MFDAHPIAHPRVADVLIPGIPVLLDMFPLPRAYEKFGVLFNPPALRETCPRSLRRVQAVSSGLPVRARRDLTPAIGIRKAGGRDADCCGAFSLSVSFRGWGVRLATRRSVYRRFFLWEGRCEDCVQDTLVQYAARVSCWLFWWSIAPVRTLSFGAPRREGSDGWSARGSVRRTQFDSDYSGEDGASFFSL